MKDRLQALARDARIRQVIAAIPYGCVASYGQVAALAGLPRGARLVGRVLRHASPALPWHRVVAAGGRIAVARSSPVHDEQVARLHAEGVACRDGKVDVARHGWRPGLDELLWGPLAFAEGED